MTNSEINEAVAKKLGVAQEIYHDCTPAGCMEFPHWKPYSTSTEAAWEIVEHLAKDEGIQGISLHTPEYSSPHTLWHFRIISSGNLSVFEETAATAPLAICLAFLKLP